MSVFNKLFSIKEDKFHYIVKILGIKFKHRSLKLTIKEVKKLKSRLRIDLFDFNQNFLWVNRDKLTYKEKKWFLETNMYERLGYFPDLKNPKSFNEKLNWMKLNYENPLAKKCIDKAEFKDYVKERLGEGYTIPLIGVYNTVNNIDFDKLPDKFVVKSTLNGGAVGVEIVKDKRKLDIDKLKYKFNILNQEWNKSYYTILTNGSKDLKPRIIIEEYMEQLNGQLYDYKFHCFHGEPKYALAVQDRDLKGGYKFEFVDMDWNRLDFHRGNKKNLIHSTKPKCFDEMVRISKILSKDFPFVRVDFYEVDGKVYVGELTFNPCGGFGKYEPREWDYKIGELLDLDKLEKEFLVKNQE